MKLIPNRDQDLHDHVAELFSDLQIDLIACETCGDYHPPEMHLSRITPFDQIDPEEA